VKIFLNIIKIILIVILIIIFPPAFLLFYKKILKKYAEWGSKKEIQARKDNAAFLEQAGFNITKNIIIEDFEPENERWTAGRYQAIGLWVDYPAKRFAICPSIQDSSIHIFKFSELMDYEILEGTRSMYRGGAVGFGPLAVAFGNEITLSDDLWIRVSMGGENEAKILKIILFSADNTDIKRGVNTNVKFYKSRIECARAMIDEFGNIKRLSQ